MRKYLTNFIKTYKGPKLKIIATGAGASLAQLVTIPGSSLVVDSIYIPYSQEALHEYVIDYCEFPLKSVSKETVEGMLSNSTEDVYSGECTHIIVSGALQSTNYRRGENHVWYGIRFGFNPDVFTEIKLEKLTKEQHEQCTEEALSDMRLRQDELVTRQILDEVLKLATDGV